MHAFHLRIRVLVSSSVTVLLSSCSPVLSGVPTRYVLVGTLLISFMCRMCFATFSLVARSDSFRHLQGLDFSPIVRFHKV